MTFYIRHKQTGKDVILKSIDIPVGRAKVEINDGEEQFQEEWELSDIIELYDFRYDIY